MNTVPSPCISLCKMDPKQGLCVGCGRTLDEIARWSSMNDAQKREVWVMLEERKRAGLFVPQVVDS
jgi:uncharacterized protein